MSLFDNLLNIFKAPLPDGQKVVLAHKEIESNDNVLIDKMLGKRGKLDPASLQWFSGVMSISLAKAHRNTEIWNRGGRGLFIIEFDGDPDYSTIRFNDINTSLYPIRTGHVKGAFNRIYLTNTAQAGKTLKFVIGYRNFAEYMMLGTSNIVKIQDTASTTIDPATTGNITTLLQTLMNVANPKDYKDLWDVLTTISGLDFAEQTTLATIAGLDFAEQTTLATIAGLDFAEQTTLALIKAKTDNLDVALSTLLQPATTPTIYNVVMTTATQEYSQALPAGTKSLLLQAEDGLPFRFAFVIDHAGNDGGAGAATRPYKTILSGSDYYEPRLKLTDKTVYFACDTAAKYMEIIAWV